MSVVWYYSYDYIFYLDTILCLVLHHQSYLFRLKHAVSGMISGMIMTAFTFVGSMYNNVIYPTLPMSTNGCPANTNLTLRPNTTWSWENATANYVFKGYRIFVGIYLYNGPTGDMEIIHWTIVPA